MSIVKIQLKLKVTQCIYERTSIDINDKKYWNNNQTAMTEQELAQVISDVG